MIRNFIYFLLAVALFVILLPIAVTYTIIKFSVLLFIKPHKVYSALTKLFIELALAIDQLGNVMLQAIMNDLFVKKGGYKYGDEDETISQVTGENELRYKLTKSGKIFKNFLNLCFGANHTTQAVYFHRKKIIDYYNKYIR